MEEQGLNAEAFASLISNALQPLDNAATVSATLANVPSTPLEGEPQLVNPSAVLLERDHDHDMPVVIQYVLSIPR